MSCGRGVSVAIGALPAPVVRVRRVRVWRIM